MTQQVSERPESEMANDANESSHTVINLVFSNESLLHTIELYTKQQKQANKEWCTAWNKWNNQLEETARRDEM